MGTATEKTCLSRLSLVLRTKSCYEIDETYLKDAVDWPNRAVVVQMQHNMYRIQSIKQDP